MELVGNGSNEKIADSSLERVINRSDPKNDSMIFKMRDHHGAEDAVTSHVLKESQSSPIIVFAMEKSSARSN
jgi:hypothetical protein